MDAQPAGAGAEFTTFTYEVLCCITGGEIFADDFEVVGLSVWSGAVGANEVIGG